MKGKLLTLTEVKNLEDGVKVWVDYPKTDTLFKHIKTLCEKKDFPFMRLDILGTNGCLGLEGRDSIQYKAYEWIED